MMSSLLFDESELRRPKLLDEMRQTLRVRRYSDRTEDTYCDWARRYILFHGKRHPAEMGAEEVTAFLTHLAVDLHVAASTQNQALAALLFLYGEVLEIKLPWMKEVVRARRPVRVPVVLTREEAQAAGDRRRSFGRPMGRRGSFGGR